MQNKKEKSLNKKRSTNFSDEKNMIYKERPSKRKSKNTSLFGVDVDINDVLIGVNGFSNNWIEDQEDVDFSKSEKLKNNSLSNEKFLKTIISTRKSIRKKTLNFDKQNKKRVKKCNDYLVSKNDEYREIYLKIDEYNNNGKKTIVYFIDSFFPVIDGVVSVVDNYATLMQKYYNIVVCAPKHKQTCYKTDKYFVLFTDSVYIKKQGYDLGFPQMDAVFQKYLSLLKIDLIHLQSPFNMGTFGLALAKRRKVPCLITFHSQFKQNFYNAVKSEVIATWLTKMLMGVYEKADKAITMNDFASKIMNEYGLKKQITLIPNATDLKPQEFDKEFEDRIIQKHKIDKSKFNMIFIGRFVEVKNVYFILDIIQDLYKINKDFNFIFLGYGPEQSHMQKICRENGLENVVKFTGKIDSSNEKAVIIKNSNLLVFPSTYDTDGIVKIECACYEVPTICIENTGVASSMVNNQNAFIEKYTKEAFVKKIDYLIKNVDFVKKIGKNAKQELYITWEDVCEKLYNLYEETLKSYYFKNAKKNKNKTTKKI